MKVMINKLRFSQLNVKFQNGRLRATRNTSAIHQYGELKPRWNATILRHKIDRNCMATSGNKDNFEKNTYCSKHKQSKG